MRVMGRMSPSLVERDEFLGPLGPLAMLLGPCPHEGMHGDAADQGEVAKRELAAWPGADQRLREVGHQLF